MTLFGFRILRNFGKNVNRFNGHFDQKRQKYVKAAVLKEFKQPLAIEEVKLEKKLKPHQIKVKVSYCSVNPSDQEIIHGYHDFNPKLPFVPGYEISGEVIELGKVAKEAGFNIGDKVIGLNKESCGGFAQECIVQKEDCFHIPQGIPMKVCSALLDGYTIALLGLVRRGRIKEGDTVLITAAGGGVGLSAVDLAANVYKSKVIAVCSTEEKAALVREKGAFAALKYSKNFPQEVNKITNGKGVNIVFDATGGEVFENALHCVSCEGKLILASNAARRITSINPNSLLPNAICLIAVSPWFYRKNDVETYMKTVEDVIDMAEQELIVPHVSKEYSLEEINKAFEYMTDATCTGKVVIRIDD